MTGSSWEEGQWVDERDVQRVPPPMYEPPYDYGRTDHRYSWTEDPFDPRPARTVSYVVLVDGRVVDHWDEPLVESPWLDDPRVDRVHRLWREPPRPKPEPKPWLETMRWLEHVVGGPEPLATLTTEDLPDEAFELPEQAVGDGDLAARFRRATTLLDDLADEFYDAEMRTAFRRALAAVGTQLLGGVQMCDPAQVAASVCWVVVRANGLMTPAGRATRTTVTSRVGLESFPTTRAKMVSRLLGAPQPSWVSRPYGVTALEPLARTDLLTSRTRKELTSLRDAATAAEAQAVEAQAAARGRDLLIDRGLDLRDLS